MARFTATGLEFATKRVNGGREDEGHEVQRPGKNHQKRLRAGPTDPWSKCKTKRTLCF